MKSKELKKFWNKFLEFKIGDRVKIIGYSAYKDEPDEYKTAFVGITEDLEHLEEEKDEE